MTPAASRLSRCALAATLVASLGMLLPATSVQAQGTILGTATLRGFPVSYSTPHDDPLP